MRMRSSWLAWSCAAWLIAGTLSAGEDLVPTPWERLQIHGFASLTAVQTSANRFFGDSPNTSFDFSEVAVNASYQLNTSTLFAGQVLARRAGAMYDGTPSLDYALADLTLDATVTRRLGVRLGRLKNPLGLYNETRDVPFTRPSIFLPQVVYFDKVRNMALSSDGLMLYGDLYGERGNLSLTLGGGQSVIDDNLEWTLLGRDFSGKFRAHGVSWVGSLWYATLGERLRLGVSGLASSFSYRPGVGRDFGAGQTNATYAVASAQYNTEDWTLTAEYSRLPLEWQGQTVFFPSRKTSGEGYYLQGAYRLRPELELTLRYEEGFADRHDQDGTRTAASTGGLLPPYAFFAKIWTLGVRWDIGRHVMLRADYQRHQGGYALSFRENDASTLAPDWDLYALQVAVRF